MKCYYHIVDLDGKCSAAIVKYKYAECECIGVNYPDRPDFNRIKSGEKVFIVDFSFGAADMIRLRQHAEIIWIDHHKSAIEKMPAMFEPLGIREISRAGCELTWQYLFPNEPMPDAVRLLGRYDVWDHSDSETLAFQYGMRMGDWFPDEKYWRVLFEDPDAYMDYVKNGDILLRYEEQQNRVYAKASAFPVEFEGYEAWAINKYFGNSKVFESLENDKPLWVMFGYKNGGWKYSLYAANGHSIDVSKIAVKYGGGGHVGAAGFRSDKYLLTEMTNEN